MSYEDEEFELVPLSPIRRMEKRLEKLETGKGDVDTKEFFTQLVEIVRMNQQLVDELAKANDALRIELSRLPGKLDELIGNMTELVSFIKASAGSEMAENVKDSSNMEPLLNKMDSLIELNKKIVENNETLMGSMNSLSSKMNRTSPRPMLMRGKKLPPIRRKE